MGVPADGEPHDDLLRAAVPAHDGGLPVDPDPGLAVGNHGPAPARVGGVDQCTQLGREQGEKQGHNSSFHPHGLSDDGPCDPVPTPLADDSGLASYCAP